MEPMRLTKGVVDALEPKPKRYLVRDLAIPGFGVRVEPSGIKTYVLRYRVGGREAPARWETLGRHGVITAEEARQKAEHLRGVLANCVDPRGSSAKGRGKLFRDAAEKFLKDHARVHLKPKTIRDYEDLLRLHILPRLGKTLMSACSLETVRTMHLSIGAHKQRTANKCLLLVSAILSKCEEWEWRPVNSNPCPAVTKFEDAERTRYLSEEELAALLIVLDALQEAHPMACDIIRLMINSGRRFGEIQTLRWSEIDLERGLIERETKTGKKVFAVDDDSLAILRRQPREAEWVFPGNPGKKGGRKPTTSAQQVWADKIRPLLGIQDVRLHDLRHNLASYALNADVDAKLVGSLLGHVDRRSTDRYAHVFAEKLREKANVAQQAIQEARRRGYEKAIERLAEIRKD